GPPPPLPAPPPPPATINREPSEPDSLRGTVRTSEAPPPPPPPIVPFTPPPLNAGDGEFEQAGPGTDPGAPRAPTSTQSTDPGLTEKLALRSAPRPGTLAVHPTPPPAPRASIDTNVTPAGTT